MRNIWAERIADAALVFYVGRRGLLVVKPKSVHPLVLRFLLDSESIEHLGRLGALRSSGDRSANKFPRVDGRKHLYRLNPQRLDEIRRWALLNAPPLVVRFRRGVGLRLEPQDWEAWPKPDWPWYSE